MRACQRKTGLRVVEGCSLPCSCRVAGRASLRESRRDVIWICRLIEVAYVA